MLDHCIVSDAREQLIIPVYSPSALENFSRVTDMVSGNVATHAYRKALSEYLWLHESCPPCFIIALIAFHMFQK